jgi:hypothetical protein
MPRIIKPYFPESFYHPNRAVRALTEPQTLEATQQPPHPSLRPPPKTPSSKNHTQINQQTKVPHTEP